MSDSVLAWEWARCLHLPALAMLAAAIVAWTLLSRRYGAYVLPAPWSIVTGFVEMAVAIGTVLIMLSARPSRVRELIRNDGAIECGRLVDDLNTMIMEEVERQQE